jgi:uncharacterized membrane protein YjfL (UPF0719 family)
MEVTTLSQTLLNLLISLGYAIVTLLVSVITLYLVDHYIYRNIDFIEEIKKGNIAASIFYSVILIFVAVIVTVAIN